MEFLTEELAKAALSERKIDNLIASFNQKIAAGQIVDNKYLVMVDTSNELDMQEYVTAFGKARNAGWLLDTMLNKYGRFYTLSKL